MARRQILQLGDPVLRQKAKEVTVFDERLWALLDDLKDTMKFADGIGLAAPQVGILKRAAIICTDDTTMYEIINPVITKQSGSQMSLEGCLSVEKNSGNVNRPQKITVEYFDRCGIRQKIKITEKLTVCAFCHEIDHLDGVLYIDKLIKESKGDGEK